jgi:hypothetical protein
MDKTTQILKMFPNLNRMEAFHVQMRIMAMGADLAKINNKQLQALTIKMVTEFFPHADCVKAKLHFHNSNIKVAL